MIPAISRFAMAAAIGISALAGASALGIGGAQAQEYGDPPAYSNGWVVDNERRYYHDRRHWRGNHHRYQQPRRYHRNYHNGGGVQLYIGPGGAGVHVNPSPRYQSRYYVRPADPYLYR